MHRQLRKNTTKLETIFNSIAEHLNTFQHRADIISHTHTTSIKLIPATAGTTTTNEYHDTNQEEKKEEDNTSTRYLPMIMDDDADITSTTT